MITIFAARIVTLLLTAVRFDKRRSLSAAFRRRVAIPSTHGLHTLLALVLLTPCVSMSVNTTCAGERTDAARAALPAELLEHIDDMCARIVFVREKDFVDEPKVVLTTRDQMQEILLLDFDTDMPPERLQAVQKSLTKLGVVPEDFDLHKALLKILTEQIAGGYDPRSRTLYLVDSWSTPVQRFVLSHELAHVLQDQHYDIMNMPLNDEHNDDLALVTRSLLEGEAMLVSTRFLDLLPLSERFALLLRLASEGFAATGSFLGMSASLENAPLYIRETLLFPYLQGTLFITFAHAFDGWKAVDTLYTDMPQSTEQLLHPMKFFAKRDEPVVINLPDLTDNLEGWRLLTWNILGEFGTSLLLRSGEGCAPTAAESSTQASHAAAGWGGDLYQVYEHIDGRLAVIWFSTWDTPTDASELHAALQSALIRRYELEELTERTAAEPPDANAADHDQRDTQTWHHAPGHTIFLSRSGLDVLLVNGFDADITTQIVQSIWDQVKKSTARRPVAAEPVVQ